MALTITEALAEIKTISKRVEKKREAINGFLARQDGVRDPLEKEGGSVEFIKRERQGVSDLEARMVALRRGIQRANDETAVTIGARSMPIADWLVWRRDIAPGERAFLNNLRANINGIRQQAQKQGNAVVTAASDAVRPQDVIINVNEQALAAEIEALEEVLGALDGQLSLKNATTIVKE
jgi:hypothetical protein